MATTHRTAWLLLSAVLLAAACDSSSGDPATPATTVPDPATGVPTAEATILRSADGVVQLEVPAGAVLEGTALAIEVVDPAEVTGLEDAAPLGSAYRLQPTEIAFVEPLIVNYRVPLEAIGRSGGVPLVYTALERGGEARRALDQRSEVVDGDLIQQSKIDRFGTFVLVDGGADITIDPAEVTELAAGDSFTATVTVAATDPPIEPGYDIAMRWLASGVLGTESAADEEVTSFRGTDDWVLAKEFACEGDGSGEYSAELSIVVSNPDAEVPNRQIVTLGGAATCGDVGR